MSKAILTFLWLLLVSATLKAQTVRSSDLVDSDPIKYGNSQPPMYEQLGEQLNLLDAKINELKGRNTKDVSALIRRRNELASQ